MTLESKTTAMTHRAYRVQQKMICKMKSKNEQNLFLYLRCRVTRCRNTVQSYIHADRDTLNFWQKLRDKNNNPPIRYLITIGSPRGTSSFRIQDLLIVELLPRGTFARTYNYTIIRGTLVSRHSSYTNLRM